MSIRSVFAAIAVGSFFVAAPAHAETLMTDDNPSQFVSGVHPELGNSVLNNTAETVCYRTFCASQSSATKGAVWSAEHLTIQQVSAAKGASRKEMEFHPDENIPAQDSATLADYRGRGMDRGHMAPWADSADPDCFTLANIVPQNSDNNRHLWEGIETSVRDLVYGYGDVYVVSGPIFQGAHVVNLNGRVVVPSALYKAVYVPSRGVAGVYITGNLSGNQYALISINELQAITKTDVFPTLPVDLRNKIANLPAPKHGGQRIDPNQLLQLSADGYAQEVYEAEHHISNNRGWSAYNRNPDDMASNGVVHGVLRGIGNGLLHSLER